MKVLSALSVSTWESKKFLVIMAIVVAISMIDSQVGYVADFVPEQLSSMEGIAAFIGYG